MNRHETFHPQSAVTACQASLGHFHDSLHLLADLWHLLLVIGNGYRRSHRGGSTRGKSGNAAAAIVPVVGIETTVAVDHNQQKAPFTLNHEIELDDTSERSFISHIDFLQIIIFIHRRERRDATKINPNVAEVKIFSS